MTIQRERRRKSVALSKEELKAFKKLYRSFPTRADAELHFGLSRQVMDIVEIKGSGRYDTIAAILAKIAEVAKSVA